jgi:hypothetical protein
LLKQNNTKVYKNIGTYIGQLFGLGHVFLQLEKKRKPFVYEVKQSNYCNILKYFDKGHK